MGYFIKLFLESYFTRILCPDTWALSGTLFSYPTACKGKQCELLRMCYPPPAGWLGLLRWLPFQGWKIWRWIGCMMEEKGQRPIDSEYPHPRGALGGTLCPVLPCAEQAVVLIVGLHWWMAPWLHQDHAALKRPMQAGGGCPAWTPQTTICPALCRGLSPGDWRTHELIWVGMEGGVGKVGWEPPYH